MQVGFCHAKFQFHLLDGGLKNGIIHIDAWIANEIDYLLLGLFFVFQN